MVRNYLIGFQKFYSKRINRLIIFAVVFFITSGTLLYWIIGNRNEEVLIRQTFQRKQIIARSGATSIESFVNLVSKALLILDDQISVDKENTQAILDKFIKDWEDTPVSGIIVTDADGVVRYNSNKYTEPTTGESIADRQYFDWAKKAGFDEVYVGNPVKPRFGSLENQFVVTITTPIEDNGEFSGVINIAVLLSELTDVYINPLKISEDNRIYLIASDGTILTGPHEKLIGVNYLEYLAKNPYEGGEKARIILKDAAAKREGGTLALTLPDESTGKLRKFLIAHSSVDFTFSHWTLAVAFPEDSLSEAYLPFHINQIVVLLFLTIVVVTFSIFTITSIRITKKKAFLKGLNHAQKYKN